MTQYSLRDCLTRDTADFGLPQLKAPNGYLYYQDNGASVLGVAHLDSVLWGKPRFYGSDCVSCPQLDDRLGAYCLLNALPAMGITLDILLTDCEEVGATTAQYFEPSKRYNWIIEFDRAGTDIVFYQYDDFAPYWRIREGIGSYSDIVDLEQCGVCCANIGIGYHNQHTKDCYAYLSDTRKQLRRFARFYRKYKDTRFPYSPPVDLWAEDSIYSPNEESYYETARRHRLLDFDDCDRAYADLSPFERDEIDDLYWEYRRIVERR